MGHGGRKNFKQTIDRDGNCGKIYLKVKESQFFFLLINE